MTFDLNIKRIINVIIINLIFLIILLFITFYSLGLSELEQLKNISTILITIGCSGLIFCGGTVGVLLVLYMNVKIIFYNRKNILTVTEKEIIYDTYNAKKVRISKDNINRIYTTLHTDDYLISNKYVVIVTKEPIKYNQKIDNILSLFRLANLKYSLYINISELSEEPEKIVQAIEQKTGIEIKKKTKTTYFKKF